MKVISVEQFLYNRLYTFYPLNANFNDLPFDGFERLIIRRKLYHIYDHIAFRLINGLIVYVKMNRI